jgi:DNA-binding MarR family transcriptional regulator
MIAKKHYVALSDFRFRLAQFLHFSESAAREAGMTPLQYLLLLHLHGFARRDWATVGELAERLNCSHQAAVAVVKRCEVNGLVRKRRSPDDARCVEIHLTPRARRLVERVAVLHIDQLERLGEVFHVAHATRSAIAKRSPDDAPDVAVPKQRRTAHA